MSHRELTVARSADIPLREVSALCVRNTDSGIEVLAAGDHDAALVRSTLRHPLVWQRVDVSAALGTGPSQIEAMACDGSGRAYLLLEEPSVVVVVDLASGHLLGRIGLRVPADHAMAASWKDASSRGEGLVLMRGGHLLVAKEKHPAALIEFGPAGEAPLGIGPNHLLSPRERFADGGDYQEMVPLAVWELVGHLAGALGDVSDLAVGPDGHVYLLSDKSSRVARLSLELAPDATLHRAEVVWNIEGRPKKAEGLAVLDDGTALVALDTKKPKENGLLLEPPVTA